MGGPTNISIVIPLFNKGTTIARAIGSILRQTYPAKEIVIVDDGSTDNGVETVKSLSEGTEKIMLIQQSNAGVGAARNKGIHAASSEWIAFLDADDEWDSGYLQEISELISLFPDANVCGTSYYFGDFLGKKKQAYLSIRGQGTRLVIPDYFRVATDSAPPLWTSAVCVKKTTIEEIGGFPEGIIAGEDLLTWARLANKNKIAYSTKPLAVFWLDKAHTYHAPPNRKFEKGDYVGDELKGLLRTASAIHYPDLKRYISLWHKMRASTFIRYGEFFIGFSECRKALMFNPWNIRVYVYIVLLFLPTRLRLYIFRKLSSY